MRTGITRWAAGGALACVLALAGTAWGETTSTDNVTDQIRQLRDLVNKQQDQINQLSHTNSLAPSISNDQRQEILALIRDELKDQKLPDWVSNMKITGDFRFRTEYIKQATTFAQQASANSKASLVPATALADRNAERTRQRIRVRLGFFEKVNDEVDVGIQLATGGGNNGGADPISTNQTLGGDGFPGEEKVPVWFDLAFANYHPKAVPGLNVYMGRMPNPFLEVGDSELIWDSDLRFDGMAVKYSKQVAEGLTLFASGGGFWLNENGTVGQADTSVWGAQGYATLALPQLTKGAYATAGLSYYKYLNIDGYPVGSTAAGAFPTSPGNTTTALINPIFNSTAPYGYTGYDCEYGIVNPFIEVGFDDPWLHKRISFYGDLAVNPLARDRAGAPVTASQRDHASNDFAWLLGASYGTLKNPGDWKVSYNYRRVGADAVVAAFCDSDAAGGGTDFQGSKLSAAYQIAKGWVASFNYFNDDVYRLDVLRNGVGYQRLEMDFVFSF